MEITGQRGRGQGPRRGVSTLPWGSCGTAVVPGGARVVTTGKKVNELAASFTRVRFTGKHWCWNSARQGPSHYTLPWSLPARPPWSHIRLCLTLPPASPISGPGRLDGLGGS